MKNNKVITFKEYQKELKNNFQKINDAFKKENIEWFAHSGTLLGAVRHGDIIPWDDDIDMGMEYSQYKNKFMLIKKIVEKSTKGEMFLERMFERKSNFPGIAKILSKKKYSVKIKNKVYKRSLEIDIMLGVNKNKTPKLKIYFHSLLLAWIVSRKKVNNDYWIFNKLRNRLQNKIESIFEKNSLIEGNKKEFKLLNIWIMRNDKYNLSKIVWLNFGDSKIPCPKNYLEVLKTSFGNWSQEPKNKEPKKILN